MAREIARTTDQIIRSLYAQGNPNKAVLASARSAGTITSVRAQAVWPVMMAKLDQKYLSRTGEPTYAEVAIYTAIRFYALHQQGKSQFVYGPAQRTTAPEEAGVPLFEAFANLRQNEANRVALDRRVGPLLATTNVTSVIHALSALVAILKATNWQQRIDYAQLAQDIYDFQWSYQAANRIRLKWGQQYYRPSKSVTKSEGKSNNG